MHELTHLHTHVLTYARTSTLDTRRRTYRLMDASEGERGMASRMVLFVCVCAMGFVCTGGVGVSVSVSLGALCLCVHLSFTPCLCCRAQSVRDTDSLSLFLCRLPILPPPPNQPYTSPPPFMCPQDQSVDRANPSLETCKDSSKITSCQWQYTVELERGPFESLYWIGVCVIG